jgi:hypothetical protein
MSNIIAKQFKFTLDSKSVKTYREKSFVCYNTDSIKFTIDIIEDGAPKSIVGANIEVNYSYPNGESESMKQEFEDGIVIVGGSTIEITPKNNCLVPTDVLMIEVNIYDKDEFITLQPFMFKVLKSIESDIYDKAETVTKTMRSIADQMAVLTQDVEELEGLVREAEGMIESRTSQAIESAQEMLSGVTVTVDEMTALVDEKIEETNLKLLELQNTASTRVDNFIETSETKVGNLIETSNVELNALVHKLQDVSVELDEYFLRSTPLTPIDYNGKLLFTTDLLIASPTSLVNKTYILTTTGSVSGMNIITTNVAILYFTQENDKVVINYTTLANKSVQGKSITIIPQFSNMATSIPRDTFNFKIYIETNLLTSCIDNATCTITSNSAIGNKL